MQKKGRYKILFIFSITAIIIFYLFNISSIEIDVPYINNENDQFLVSQGLEPSVDFWKKIFTETSIYSLVYYTPENYINIKQIDAKLDFSISNKDLLNVILVSDGEEIAKYSVFDLMNDDINVFNLNDVKNKIDEIYDDLEVTLHSNNTLKEDEHVGYARGRKEKFEKSWRYSGQFMKKIEDIFEEEGVPRKITNLAFVESNFNPYALSENNALGIFQMIPSTAKKHGLIVNKTIDERRDPLLESKATARYLKELHNEFGHWLWAINAYHSGEGNLRKALLWAEKYYPEKPNSFKGSLRDYQYMKVIQEFPNDKEFNTHQLKYGRRSSQYTTLFLAFLQSLDYFNNISSIDEEVKINSIIVSYNNDYFSEKIVDIMPGDTLSEISYNNNVTVEDIKQWNSLINSDIHAGKTLLLYVEKPPLTFESLMDEANLNAEEKEWIYEYNFSYRKSDDTFEDFIKTSIYSGSTINTNNSNTDEIREIMSNY